jgi:hypothetical protein
MIWAAQKNCYVSTEPDFGVLGYFFYQYEISTPKKTIKFSTEFFFAVEYVKVPAKCCTNDDGTPKQKRIFAWAPKLRIYV